MANQVLLLRGINLGSRRRIAMPELRALLTDAGLQDVRSYMQSGNVVATSQRSPAELGSWCRELIAERFGFDVPVLVRTSPELDSVLSRNPLAEVATDPKRYQVTFLQTPPSAAALAELAALAVEPERMLCIDREIYAWYPAGAARSRLWNRMAGSALGVLGTARNWSTVTALAEMAREV